MFRNFGSFGNKITEIDFRSGLTALLGVNGVGKCLKKDTEITINIPDREVLNLFSKFKELSSKNNTTLEDVYKFYKKYPQYKSKIYVETRKGFYPIKWCDITAKNSEIFRIETKNNYIECAPTHRVWKDSWVYAKDIKVNDLIETKNGMASVKKLYKLDYREDLYDIEVDEVHEYYTNNIVSHNSTVLLDALSYGLFSKPYRNIKKSELINWSNEKDLWVSVEFERNHDTYVIERGMKPNILAMYKNGQEMELLSSNKFIQDDINKIIGINYFLFKQIIATASSNNKSFLALSASEKRSTIESIFNLSKISDMLSLVKIDKSDNNLKLSNLNSTIESLDKIIENIQTQIAEIDILIDQYHNDKKRNLEEIKKVIIEHNKTKHEKELQIERIKSDINKLKDVNYNANIKENDKEVEQLNKSIGSLNATLRSHKSKLDIIKNNTICPTCKTKMNEDHKLMEINNIKCNIRQDLNELQNNKNIIIKLKQDIINLKHNRDTYKKLENEMNYNLKDIKNLDKNINDYINRYKAKEAEQSSLSVKTLSNMLEEKQTELDISLKDITHCREKSTMFELLIDMFGDTGIKTEFYNVITPLLNKDINELLQQFELPVLLNFDNNLNYTIKSIYQSDKDINYYSFSEGEKKRIDLAMMLSFINLSKTISNWDCNLLIADELFTNLDKDGIGYVIQSLRDLASSNANMCLYIVSHNLSNDTEYSFEHKMLVTKNDGFSKVMYI